MTKVKIKTGVNWDDKKDTLTDQEQGLVDWYMSNINSKITDLLTPDSLDEFGRPISFSIEQDGYVVTVKWHYIEPTASNWACKKHEIKIKQKGK